MWHCAGKYKRLLSGRILIFLLFCCRRAYKLFFVEGVPSFLASQRDEARRFVVLLDILYEGGCSLVCSAHNSSPDLIFARLLAAAAKHGADPNMGRSTKLTLPDAGEMITEERFAGDRDSDTVDGSVMSLPGRSLLQEEVLMYHRASSRLKEMCQLLLQE